MAFSFGGGAASSATPASTGFSFGSAPAAAASPGFSFGGSAPAFGAPAASSAPAAATPTPVSTGFPFGGGGAASVPAFGAAASAPAFGAPSSTPAFSFSSAPAAASGGGVFGAQPAPAFGSAFGQPAQAAAQQAPFTHATKFEELDKATQDKLAQIQEQVSKYESDRQKVMQLEHLQDNAALQQGLDADTSSLSAELRLLQASIKAEQESLADFKEKAVRLLKSTEAVVRTYERTKLWRDAPAMYQRQEPLKPAQAELLAQPVLLPGPFLEEAVAGCSSNVAEYSRVLEEVEQVLAASSLQDVPPGDADWVTSLPTVVSNMHDYFIAVAAKLERSHAEVQRLKALYLARLRARGITADPFERARRQEQQLLAAQQQQQVPRGAAGVGPHALGAQPGLPALPAPSSAAGAASSPAAAGGLFGSSPQQAAATPAAPAAGGLPFGSPFVSATPFGGAAGANGSLSRSNSKARGGKKR